MINPRDLRAAARVARQQQGAALVANVAALDPDENAEEQVPVGPAQAPAVAGASRVIGKSWKSRIV